MESSGTLRAVRDLPTTLVDSCVLLDVLTDDPKWADWSDDAIAEARDLGFTVINPIVYAEVAAGFDSIEELDAALPESELERVDLPYQAGFVAGKAFLAYRRRGGEKRSPLPDFYIGAHAAVSGYRLLTRHTSRFRTYFPNLELITPDTTQI
ncbi:type II toxin-antitoxin system VapC family toxin [Nocardia sp. NBC_00508]|uniref:type II toxin-antitoxin system VapC family toxin n=1 Tax=Nocardia sp. NBC_00508 TaxID=2975992 RepID=UPI002E8008B2|nr:type II toxin-antitoxin system VapC family toxin [Nocardia sp. NBC_00508]WUD65098.1 type II toxin-antitoxin system VapC family toxin [Nocardia sp. NBC_00508]